MSGSLCNRLVCRLFFRKTRVRADAGASRTPTCWRITHGITHLRRLAARRVSVAGRCRLWAVRYD
jgi:hypothetical protein